MKAGDVVSVYSDIKGKCKKGAKEFDGTKVFLGNGISELSRRGIFNGLAEQKYVIKYCLGEIRFFCGLREIKNNIKIVALYEKILGGYNLTGNYLIRIAMFFRKKMM